MNYIGSKQSLLGELESVLETHNVPAEGIALDLFSGTGAVAQLLKLRGHVTYANDWQYYSYVINIAFIQHNYLPRFEALLSDGKWEQLIHAAESGNSLFGCSILGRVNLSSREPAYRVLSYLDQLDGCRGAFYHAYCQGGAGGRQYFSRGNGLRIQAIRDEIAIWRQEGLISDKEQAWLVASLLESADRVANTASVYGAYLKHVKKPAQKPLSLIALQPIGSRFPEGEHRVFCEDGLALLDRIQPEQLQLVYVDPPYNHRQYSANYHVLETIARWDLDDFVPRGVTGLRSAGVQRSDYCMQSRADQAFRQLFRRVNSEFLLFSYNNEGLLPESKLRDLFEEFCEDVHFRKVPFRRFRADVDRETRVYKADSTQEFLVLGRPKAPTNEGLKEERGAGNYGTVSGN